MRFKQSDYVRIIEREVTPADVKNRTYYPFFGGLCGTVDRIYDNEVCVNVDPESMPKDIAKRHAEVQESIKRKWLNGLSGEVRNKLTPEEKQFQLAYTILVQSADLEKAKPDEAKPVAVKNVVPVSKAEPVEPVAEKVVAEVKAKAKPTKAAKPKAEAPVQEKNGLTEAELAFLKEREKALKGK